jgi:hypothetical protein
MGRTISVMVICAAFLAACGGAASPPAGSPPAASTAPGASAALSAAAEASAGAPGGSAGVTVEGSLATSGAYDATWTWQPGNDAETGQFSVTLTSDKGTFASIQADKDGNITFGSGQVSAIGVSLTASGAQVKLDPTYGAVCGVTVDADLAGAHGGALHLKGSLTVHGDPLVNC